MEIDLDFAVKTFFPQASFVQVYFEAVANALDAGADDIEIAIRSDGKVQAPVFDLEISDNGEGFTDISFGQFKRLQHPKDEHHKGLGRLVYMQYFERVRVESLYEGGGRRFTFSPHWNGVSEPIVETSTTTRRTTLRFSSFKKAKLNSYDDLKPGVIRDRLIMQFLPRLHERKRTGRPLTIRITLDTKVNTQQNFVSDEAAVTERSVPDFDSVVISDGELGLLFGKVTLWYRIEPDSASPGILTAASVDWRTIPFDLVNPRELPPRANAIFIVESDLFAGKSDSARERLELPADMPRTKFEGVLRRKIAGLLRATCPEIEQRNEVVQNELNGRLPHLIGLFDTEPVGLIDREQAIEDAQKRYFAQQREVLSSDPMDDAAFQKALEVSSRTLTEYILYRQQIIRRLEGTPPTERESTIHGLFVPQREVFNGDTLVRDIYRNNAWLLDDKFMTFRTILSEAEMKEVVRAIKFDEESDDVGRPDISMIFSADPKAPEKVDVVVVELKKREVNDKEGTYAATQLTKRAIKLVDHCPNIQQAWYYGVIEVDDVMFRLLKTQGWVPLFSHAKVLHKTEIVERQADGVRVPCSLFLVSFDGVVKDASARNHAFLELLRSGFKSLVETAN